MSELHTLTERLNSLGLGSALTPFPGSDPVNNPFDLFRSYISEELSKITGVSRDLVYPALEWTNTPDRGDLVIPIPRLRVKGTPPIELAKKWAAEFPENSYLKAVVANGPFIQFFFNPSVLFNLVLKDILTLNDDFGNSTIGKGKRTVVEFSSPNIAKPFHAGHLRSTIIGGFISNLHEKLGYEVIRLNYLGDWGKQFGILAVGFKRYGSEQELESNPINHLFNVYVRINKDIEAEKEASTNAYYEDHPNEKPQEKVEVEEKKPQEIKKGDKKPELATPAVPGVPAFVPTSATDDEARSYFKKMEDGDEEALALWKKFRDLSIVKYKDTYKRLNIEYDSYSGESQVSKEVMQKATKLFEEKNLLTEDKGAKLIDLTPYNKKLGKAIVQKKDGTSLYLTRDVGAAMDRYEKYKFDKMIYVIASQQDLHTAQFFKILDLMGFEWASRLQHVNFGMVQGMSTRKGTVVFLDNILEETKDAMHDVMKKNEAKYSQVENPDEIADLVGIAAVMIQDMQAKRINNYAFNWSRMLSFEGDTGAYLQYAHSRLCSIERNAESLVDLSTLHEADFSLLKEPIAEELVRILAQYPDILLASLRSLEPSTVVTYLFKLTHCVSSCYDILWVAGQTPELAKARLALYSSARRVLSNGMELLNLTPVKRM
ncbi:arginine--tRNA ligase [Sugiyamaella lignohabitans]|uniref:arginine--tRNA ligase n=1 Tax=Sugiyamaella lignohabitans TaxID=796027 RepID=A0A161HFB0_9ASCO|nr:arginine--tRNA ligase [Sugiyamaella lignohabitans]ANB11171.1 arginine--tRNA ligase [Sugiyamaella lignohabitans]